MKDLNIKEMKLTKSMENFLYNDVTPHYIIFSKKMKKAHCTHCDSDVEVDFNMANHNKETKCPKCKARALWKAEHYIRYGFEDNGCGIFYTKEDDCIVVHHFEIKKCYNKFGKVTFYNSKEALREYFNKNGWVKGFDNTWDYGWKKLNIRQYDNFKGRAGEPCYHINFNWNYISTYTKNIRYVIKGTPWEHSCLDKIYKLKDNHHYWDVPKVFLRDYLINPVAEYLYKVGFYALCEHMVFNGSIPCNHKEKSLMNILCVNKEQWKELLKNGNPDLDELRKRQRMTQYGFDEQEFEIFNKYFEDDSLYRYYRPNSHTSYDELKPLYRKTLYQLDKYAISEKDFHIGEYIDYLDMSNKLGDDLNSTFILFPKDFKKAHNEMVRRWNANKQKIAMEQAKKRNEEYAKMRDEYIKSFSFEENNYKIIVPNGCDDICKEGQNLHHCVGTYVDKVCKGISIILFVRDVTNLAKSFYTLELQGDRMIQCRGKNNTDMTPEVKNFIFNFAKQKHLVATKYMGGIA